MGLLRPLLLSTLTLWAAAPAVAGPASRQAVVEAVQAPAWLERSGERRPLVPGQALANRDRIVTGSGSRVLIQLPEGSGVKLGENAQLHLNAIGQRPGGVYTAALDVLRGAFRFTTGLFPQRLTGRAINVRAATLTAGIRGTDLWGKSAEDKDLICLLEGHIVVTHPLGEPMALSEPLAFASALRDQAPRAVASVEAEQVEKWAAETEIQAGAGVLRRGGAWGVNLPPVATQAEALALYDQLREAGYPARIRPRHDGAGEEGYVYVLRVGGFAGREEARQMAGRLTAELGVAPGAVSR